MLLTCALSVLCTHHYITLRHSFIRRLLGASLPFANFQKYATNPSFIIFMPKFTFSFLDQQDIIMSSFKISETYTMLDMYFYISRDVVKFTFDVTWLCSSVRPCICCDSPLHMTFHLFFKHSFTPPLIIRPPRQWPSESQRSVI